MKFGKRLRAQMVPEWAENYVDYKALKRHIKTVAHIVPGTVRRPDVEQALFEQLLDEQLAKVNSFFAVTEAELSLSWRGLKLPRQDVVLEKTRSILSVLKTHMQRKCEAKPGQCRAYNRLKGEDNHFARFATTYEQTLTLREYTLLNYLAFSKARPAEHPFCAALSVQHARLNAAAHGGALYRCVESV